MRMIGQTQETAERGIFVKETTVVKNNKMLPVARRLRREMTLSEQHLWFRFLRSYPVKIYKQRIIESFVVDFYCAEARLVIELDGLQHYTEQGKEDDEQRTAILEQYGVQVLRFTNLDVDRHLDAVCAQIDSTIERRVAELRG